MRELVIPERLRDVVMAVTDVTAEDRRTFLSDEELQRSEEFRLERRRQEWSAARIAARLLAQRRGYVSLPVELNIGTRDLCPYAWCDGGEWSLSFTHSGSAGAAALDERPIGVDLERPRRVEPGSSRFFLNPEEAHLMDLPLADVAVHLWSAKEAAFKAAPAAALLRQVRLDRIEAGEEGLAGEWSDGRTHGRIETLRLAEGFILSVARG